MRRDLITHYKIENSSQSIPKILMIPSKYYKSEYFELAMAQFPRP
jgi:hypothetical protein